MNVFRHIWTGIVAAVAGAALALLLQVIGQMTVGLPIDYLQWIVLALASFGFLLGVAIGPRALNDPSKGNSKNSESPPISSEPNHRVISGFWRRLLAFFIDSLFLGLLGLAIGFFLFDQLANLGSWGRLIGFSVALVYFVILNSATGKGQTIGKRLAGIEVVTRTGQHISLSRSLLRYLILGTPFFLNGAMIPPKVTMSGVGHIIPFTVFGLGGAIIYLYIFNRRTRQSLHDIVTGSFVSKASPDGEVNGSIWRPHFAVVGIWFVTVICSSVAMTGLSQKGVFPELLNIQQVIQDTGKVHIAKVHVGKSWKFFSDSGSETTYFIVNTIWKRRPTEDETPARSIAFLILDNYPAIMEKDMLSVTIAYGYDIGIAHSWKYETYSFNPDEWLERLAGWKE